MKVESFIIDNWEEKATGITLTENEEWILVAKIPVDYIVDGYGLYNKKYIISRENGEEEKLKERVLKLRNIKVDFPHSFSFKNTIDLLKWCESKYGIFEFQDDKEDSIFYGKINNTFENTLIIDFIDAKGRIEKEYDYDFEIDQIRAIFFESDYFKSIQVLYLDENKL